MNPQRIFWIAVPAMLVVCASAGAISISFDYSYDTNSFFASHPAAVSGLNAAAESFLGFADDLLAIQPAGANTWSATFTHPGTGTSASVDDLIVPGETLVIYVGGRNLGTGTLAVGGPGGLSAYGTQEWLDTLLYRGQSGAMLPSPTDFGPWGGSISFNSTTNWNFDVQAGPGPGQSDFLSVAIHELAHVLGFGVSDSWDTRRSGGLFVGPVATTVYGGSVPLSADRSHWASGTIGYIYRTAQEAAMDPELLTGTRKRFTILDYAGLIDVGWDYPPPGDTNADGWVDGADYTIWADNFLASGVPPASAGGWTIGNFNEDAVVNGADYTIWSDHYNPSGGSGTPPSAVPEPTMLALICAGAAMRRRRGGGRKRW